MTDRHAAYLVTLNHDTRTDDAEATLTALRMVRGVLDVQPVLADLDQQIAQTRADNEWRNRIYKMLEAERRGED